MTVIELIKSFFGGYRDLKVAVWLDGERYFINSVDFTFVEEGFVELNVKSEGKHE